MYLGFDIGGTKCAVSIGEVSNGKVNISAKEMIGTDHNISAEEMILRLCKSADKILGTNRPTAIGISCGGPLDAQKGLIQSPPNLPGWDDVQITKILTDYYGVPSYLENDANACAVAEWLFGAGKGCKNMVFLTFGTGMGAGIIIDNKLYRGTTGSAGEVGHIRIAESGPVGFNKEGSFEGFCSGGGIAQIGKKLAYEKIQEGIYPSFCKSLDDLDNINAKVISESAKAGDETALNVYKICAEKLGLGLSMLIDILNPEAIVMGSIFTRSESLLRTDAEKIIEKEALSCARTSCRILPSALGESIGDYAAISVAVNACSNIYDRYPLLRECENDIENAINMLLQTYRDGGKILLCGNGGSAADCEHITGELMKSFMLKREMTKETRQAFESAFPQDAEYMCSKLQRSIPAISLTSQSAVMTAFSNDVDADLIYAQLVYGYGVKEDTVVGISTSGNSKNVVYAMKAAKALGLKTIALTGQRESLLGSICDCVIKVPETETYLVQEYHLPVYHYICSRLEQLIFGV